MRSRHEQSDAEEILKRAIAIDTVNTHSRDALLKTAEELGISPAAVEQAEKEYALHKMETQELAEFKAHQRQGFWEHLGAYVIVNGFLVALDLFKDYRLDWAHWPLFAWGIGLAFHAWESVSRSRVIFPKDFERWRRRRARRLESGPADK